MALKNSKSQVEILEISQIALQNAETNPMIKPLMEALGYNTAKIDEGKTILNLAKTNYNANHQEEDKKAKAYKAFEDLRLDIQAKYSTDRKKAKVIFKTNDLVLKELHLKGIIPKSYVKWLETVSIFYDTVNADTEIKAKLLPLQITPEYVTERIEALSNLETLRAAYLQTKGNAQNATKTKDKAFTTLQKWMSDFYGIARIALAEEPQLLESLGKQVKS